MSSAFSNMLLRNTVLPRHEFLFYFYAYAHLAIVGVKSADDWYAVTVDKILASGGALLVKVRFVVVACSPRTSLRIHFVDFLEVRCLGFSLYLTLLWLR